MTGCISDEDDLRYYRPGEIPTPPMEPKTQVLTDKMIKDLCYHLWEEYRKPTWIIASPTLYRDLEFALEWFRGWPRQFVLFPRLDRIEKKIRRLRVRLRWWWEERRS